MSRRRVSAVEPTTPCDVFKNSTDDVYSSSGNQQQQQQQQVCQLLHQIWDSIPEPVRDGTAERRIFPHAVVRQVHPRLQQQQQEEEQQQSTHKQQHGAAADTVVLATHLDVSKLDVLRVQATWWGGPVSAALYVRRAEDIDVFLQYQRTHAQDALRYVSFHVVLEKTAVPLPYPHNILRNLALEYLEADFFVATDVDFIPIQNAYEGLDKLLHEPRTKLRKELTNHRVFVLPAFERLATGGRDAVTEDMLPRTKTDVQDMFKKKTVIGFHMAGSPLGHGPTNFPMWLKHKTSTFYEIEYKNIFEPYVMGYRPGIPRYWEDFRGYGYNKFSWYMELHRACYTFAVLRDFYVVHMNHPMVSRTAKRDQTEDNRDYWKQFKQYLSGRYKQTCKAPAPLPQSTEA